MSILAVVRQKIKERQGKSFALLAERVDKSAVAPYCINTAENVSSEETMVLILGGAGGRGVHLRGYNGSGIVREECQSLCRRLLHRAFS